MSKQIKHPRFFATVVFAIAILALTACASQPAVQTAAPAMATQAQATSTSNPTASAPGASSPAAPVQGLVSFSGDIAPLLQDSCVSCHGGEKTSRALDLKTYESLMAGSQNGAVVNPGDAANSLLVQKIQSGKMPKRGAKWTAAQLQLLVDWVNAGAQNN